MASVIGALTCVVAPADASTLISMHLDVAAGKNPRGVLAFGGGIPPYKVFGNGTTDVTLILTGAVRAANAPTTIIGRDALKGISVEGFGDDLNVTFHETAPANVAVGTGPGQTLIVTIASSTSDATAHLAQPAAPSPTAPPPSQTANDITEVVPLKYADVSEVVGLLVAGQQIPANDTFVPQEQNFGSSGMTGGGFGGGFGGGISGLGQSTPQGLTQVANVGGGASLGQQINESIGVDRRLNAIVLTGSAETIARIKAKIALIDVPLPSVILETQVVELTDNAAHDVGIDFTNGNGQVAAASFQGKSGSTGTAALSLQAAVFAQVTRGRGKIIARPRIVAQNGSSAQIITGDALPIVTSIAVSGVNAVSQQVQYVNVGVSLQIQPRISSDGYVTSHIFSEVSSVTGYQQGYPTLSQREATTAATVRDGESFVIGGLLQQNDISSMSRLPGLGSLPLIGSLFQVRHETRENTNLYIIVTPHILTTGVNPPPASLPSPDHERVSPSP